MERMPRFREAENKAVIMSVEESASMHKPATRVSLHPSPIFNILTSRRFKKKT